MTRCRRRGAAALLDEHLTRSLPVVAPESLYPPDRRHLEAKVRCAGCGTTFNRYTFPMTASLGAGDDSVTVPVPAPVTSCTSCGAAVADDVDPYLD